MITLPLFPVMKIPSAMDASASPDIVIFSAKPISFGSNEEISVSFPPLYWYFPAKSGILTTVGASISSINAAYIMSAGTDR